MATIRVEVSSNAVAEAAADLLTKDLDAAVRQHGTATWVAAGGRNPGRAYDILARSEHAPPWGQIRILMGDERCVLPDHEDSNWHQLDARLLKCVSIPAQNELRPPAELGAEAAAAHYERTLRQLSTTANGLPRLDHVWLGVGEDGHTLSLFPNHPGLSASGLVAAVHNSPKPPPARITLTFACLAGAHHCVILAAGAGKREVIARALSGDIALPIARAADAVESRGGRVTWLLDEETGRGIPRRP